MQVAWTDGSWGARGARWAALGLLCNKPRTNLCQLRNGRPKTGFAGRGRGYVRGMVERLKPKQQGDLGEADAIAVLTRLGGEVSVPLFSSPDYDLVVDFGDGLQRVQVKTSAFEKRPGVFGVVVCTSGGNQSWSGLVRTFDRSRCDLLYVLVASERRWLIPASAVDARRQVTLGAQKYSEYEISSLLELDETRSRGPLEWAPLEGGRRSRRAGPVCKIGALAAEWVRFPPPPLPPR